MQSFDLQNDEIFFCLKNMNVLIKLQLLVIPWLFIQYKDKINNWRYLEQNFLSHFTNELKKHMGSDTEHKQLRIEVMRYISKVQLIQQTHLNSSLTFSSISQSIEDSQFYFISKCKLTLSLPAFLEKHPNWENRLQLLLWREQGYFQDSLQ